MKKVLITGATGNVGLEVIKSLEEYGHSLECYAGVRNLADDRARLLDYRVSLVHVDFTDIETCRAALEECDVLFLVRPPAISSVKRIFAPLIRACQERQVQHIVFLSVQGVEKSRFIPHHGIERLILDSGIPYTFLRPAYFMQNFTTTLRGDLVNERQIFLPAGNTKFTLVDVRDIGAVSARILSDTSQHINRAYDLTNREKLTFSEMAVKLSNQLGVTIRFKSPGLLRFFVAKRRQGQPMMFIFVMIMLHYLPRFQDEPVTTTWVEKITGRAPISFDQFIRDHQGLLVN